jgi:histidinol-phosphate/aromatic aminotransferase/cobyric acid decarboxylase-like protein
MFRGKEYMPQTSLPYTSEEAAEEAKRLKNELQRYPEGSIEETQANFEYWEHEAASKTGVDEMAELELRYWESELAKRKNQNI